MLGRRWRRCAVGCPTPVGRPGMQSVFPSMDDTCQPVGNQGVVGKAEVFQCNYGDYLIRYSRWFKGADRYGYLDSANPGATHPFWVLDSVFYGRAWISYDESPTERLRYQWSASYRGNPYTVSVEGIDAAARSLGVEQVEATPPVGSVCLDRSARQVPASISWWWAAAPRNVSPEASILVGRDELAEVRVRHDLVSRRHAHLVFRDRWIIEDLRSTNGIWLDGERVERLRISGEVRVRLGDPDSGPEIRLIAPPRAADVTV